MIPQVALDAWAQQVPWPDPPMASAAVHTSPAAVGNSWATVHRRPISHRHAGFSYREEHQRPHVAVRGEHRATLDLETGEVLAGHLPAKLHRTIRGFLDEHRQQARAAWRATQQGRPPLPLIREEVSRMDAIIDVTDVRVLSRYVVELTFETGDVRVVDLESLLEGEVFAPLTRDYELFGQVEVDPEGGTIVWPNGADISPRTLYGNSRDACHRRP